MPENNDKSRKAPEISDDDVYEAMKEINGYIDISMSDFRELYLKARRHAIERYEHSVKAGEIMTTEVISAGADTGIQEIAELLAKHDISGIPVISAEKTVIGVISEKDFLRRMISSTSLNLMSVIAECIGNKRCPVSSIQTGKAADIMVYPAIACNIETPLFRLSALMNSNRINRLPVTDEKNRLVGIVSRADLVRAYTTRTNQ